MSDSEAALRKWRDHGSLRYLARKLRITTKQVTRYWDNGWIDGSYRTPKGHRRIRYTDSTVESVAFLVRRAKETNIYIRYHLQQIDSRGTIISAEGCNSMGNLYERAQLAGLSEQQAESVATPDPSHGPSNDDIFWEFLFALEGISQEEVVESIRRFRFLPLGYLLESLDIKDFRARARATWRRILSAYRTGAGEPENLKMLRELLSEPDPKSFVVAWRKATEIERRILEYDDESLKFFKAFADRERKTLRITIAALWLHHRQQPPSATGLAKALDISRAALYRTYGTKGIRAALNLLRNDALAIREVRNEIGTSLLVP
jgi:hypothetical protein